MFRTLLSFAVAILLTAIAPVVVSAQATTQQSEAEKMRVKVMRLGVGRSRVSVKLRNQTKIKGFIGQIGEEGFSLVDPKSGTVTPVPYEEVLDVKDIRPSALLKSLIAVGTVTGIMVFIAVSLRGS